MNETEAQLFLTSLVADPAPDGIDVDAVVRRGARRRHARQAALGGVAVVAVVTVAGLVATTAGPGPRAVDPAAPAPTTPSQLDVTCTPQGIEVSGDTVAATAQGVVLRVLNTGPDGVDAGTYLDLDSPGYRMGDRLPDTATVWTRPVPPGNLTLTCGESGAASMTASVTVIDPGSFWRPATLADAGCGGNGAPFDAVAGLGLADGNTPTGAVDHLIAEFGEALTGSTLTAAPAEAGYVQSATQSWILLKDDKAYLSLQVSDNGDGTFTATPDALCGRPGDAG